MLRTSALGASCQDRQVASQAAPRPALSQPRSVQQAVPSLHVATPVKRQGRAGSKSTRDVSSAAHSWAPPNLEQSLFSVEDTHKDSCGVGFVGGAKALCNAPATCLPLISVQPVS